MSYEWYISPDHYEIALKNGISAHTLEQRIRELAWSVNKAITTPPRERATYGPWIKLAKENGIAPNTFRKRVKMHGYDMERASTQPLIDTRVNMKKVQKETRWAGKKGAKVSV